MTRRALRTHWYGSRAYDGCDVATQRRALSHVGIRRRELTNEPQGVTCRVCLHHLIRLGVLPVPKSKPRVVSFKVSKTDALLIRVIAMRAYGTLDSVHAEPCTVLDITMDITACHANGCPLDLERLAAGNNALIIHDVGGIRANLDRRDNVATAGQLLNCFLPRCHALTARDRKRIAPSVRK